MVTLPSISEVPERIQRTMKKSNIIAQAKLPQMLVQPEDKIVENSKCNILNKIAFQLLNQTSMGVTVRSSDTRGKSH